MNLDLYPNYGMTGKKQSNHPKMEFKKGHIMDLEMRNKISKTLKEKYRLGIRKPAMLGKEHSEKWKEWRRNFVSPTKDTKIEVKIQSFLKALGYEFFTHQYIKEIEHGYQCDILIPSMNLVIECDGNYWHKYPIGKDLDHIRTKELLEKGFKVLRLWEHEIKEMDIKNFEERLNHLKSSL